MIDHKIVTFLTLYETMNYHETANRLNMTQPAVTQHIKALEREYDCKLFLYDRKVLSRTREAALLEEYARSALYNEKKLSEELCKPTICNFRIGATKSVGEYMIGDRIAAFLSNPMRTAEIYIDNTEKLLYMLDENKLDFAILEGSFNKVRYGFRLFRTESMTGICSSGHRFANQKVRLSDIFEETLLLRENGSGTRDILTDILAEKGFTPQNFSRIVTVSEFSLLCRLVALGTGISFVYSSVAKGESGIAPFSIEGIEPLHELNYVYLKNTNATRLIDQFQNRPDSADEQQ